MNQDEHQRERMRRGVMGDAAVYDLATVVAERDALKVQRDELRELAARGDRLEDGATPCKRCGGRGVRAYGSTATWRGGVGGQAITNDVCDHCWGSGNEYTAWPSWRTLDALKAEVAKLKSDLEKADVEAKLLRAAFGQMREALGRCANWFGRPSPHFDDKDSLASAIHDALSNDAGRNWIDATGAVEATARRRRVGGMDWHAEVETFVPADWAGSRVVVVRVP